MAEVGGRCNGDDRGDGRDVPGGHQAGRAAQRMADEQARGLVLRLQQARGRRDIQHVGRKVRVCEDALALAQAGEVEAQHADARLRQRAVHEADGLQVLGAAEAVGKDSIGARRSLGRQVQPSLQRCATPTCKRDLFSAHVTLLNHTGHTYSLLVTHH